MSRTAACETLTVDECNKAMEGIVFDRWHTRKKWKKRNKTEQKQLDLSEAPLAYKDINEVVEICHQAGLCRKVVKAVPMGVVKG